MSLLMMIFGEIFKSKATGSDITKVVIQTNTGQFNGRWFVNGLLRGFDFTCNLGDRVISLRCLEQNPNKTDNYGNLKKYAVLARQGHSIMWVIDRNSNNFLGRMQNGEWHASFDAATQPARYDYDSAEHRAREDAAYAHIEKDINDSNFHGIPGTSGTPAANLPIEMAMQHNLPGAQNAAASPPEPMNIDQLPEIPGNVGIPDYVLAEIGEMDEEPPDWGDYE